MRDIPLLDRFSIRVMTIWSVAVAALVAAIVWCCQGQFIFALDDPYIHLAVAHNILGGTYGINVAEASSPSSSILWPWILALTEAARLGALGPLALNLLAADAALLVGLRVLRATNVIDVEAAPRHAAGVVVLLVFVVSALGLPFLGLEHSAHVLCSVMTLEALALACSGRRVTLVHVLAIAALPLVRFEGLALFATSLVALAWVGRRREAALAAVVGGLGLGLYFAFAWRLGLPLLPSSVLAKSNVTTSLGAGFGPFLAAFGQKLMVDIVVGRAPAMLALIAATLWFASQPKSRARAPMHLAVAAALCAHLAFGAYGWFGRYEVYALAIGALATLIGMTDSYAPAGRPLFAPQQGAVLGLLPRPLSSLRADFVGFALLIGLGAPYAATAVLTPAAASNVYGMQYQLRRLAQDFYPRPVAVNDIGLVSWDNPHYVLDLWGLGSETARKLRKAHALGPEAMERLANERDVEMVMIYKDWFGAAPTSWRPIAEINRVLNIVTGPKITVYLTPKGDMAAALNALAQLRASLPWGTSLNLLPEAGLAAQAVPRPAG